MDRETVEALKGLSGDELGMAISSLPDSAVMALSAFIMESDDMPDDSGQYPSLLTHACRLNPDFVSCTHLEYIASRMEKALEDVENGVSRRLIISLPPRTGKSNLSTLHLPAWILGKHPSWNIALTSYDSSLASSWGRHIRRWVESGKLRGVSIAPDAGAVKEWETEQGGGILSRSIREGFTGRGARVIIIDDPHKDFTEAHNEGSRDSVWNWWNSVAQLRLEPPSLVVVIMTRWHEDDFVGRLLSSDTSGDPNDWEFILIPAIAEENDLLGRAKGQPLYSPIITGESEVEAVSRWSKVAESVGSYVWSAMFQQTPAPAQGSIFSIDWFRYWTTDPDKVTYDIDGNPDGRVVYFSPESAVTGRWIDSWDMAFKATESGSYTVGQRWCVVGHTKYLIAQQRSRIGFSDSLEAVRVWSNHDSVGTHNPYGNLVSERLIEDKANGTAIIDTLKLQVPGIKAINPTDSKAGRARAVSATIEAGQVYFPHPDDEGNEWVRDLVNELRNFPHGKHDDQVDTMTQLLHFVRGGGVTRGTMPMGTIPTHRQRLAGPLSPSRYSYGSTPRRIR